MKLTRTELKKAIESQKECSLSVKDGLCLRVTKQGKCFWQGRKYINRKAHSQNYGNYPEVSLAQAQQLHKAWLAALTLKNTLHPDGVYTFGHAFEDWAELKKQTAVSWPNIELRIKAHLLPVFSDIPLEELTAPMLIKHLQTVMAEKKGETVKKLCNYIRQIAVLAINTGRVDKMHDLTHLTAGFVFKPKEHLAAVAPDKLPEVFRVLESKPRRYGTVWDAFMTGFYTLGRPREVAWLKWEWIDFEQKIIIFPAEIMKMKEPHVCPISSQLERLLQSRPRDSDYVFPTPHDANKPINSESVRLMLNKAGLQHIQSAHGIRAVGRTWMAVNHVDDTIAEACLAHTTGSAVILTYRRYNYLEERRPVMQQWCDYVDRCRSQGS